MTGKSRGFGFITFETSEGLVPAQSGGREVIVVTFISCSVADKMVASKHEINGKMVPALCSVVFYSE